MGAFYVYSKENGERLPKEQLVFLLEEFLVMVSISKEILKNVLFSLTGLAAFSIIYLTSYLVVFELTWEWTFINPIVLALNFFTIIVFGFLSLRRYTDYRIQVSILRGFYDCLERKYYQD